MLTKSRYCETLICMYTIPTKTYNVALNCFRKSGSDATESLFLRDNSSSLQCFLFSFLLICPLFFYFHNRWQVFLSLIYNQYRVFQKFLVGIVHKKLSVFWTIQLFLKMHPQKAAAPIRRLSRMIFWHFLQKY